MPQIGCFPDESVHGVPSDEVPGGAPDCRAQNHVPLFWMFGWRIGQLLKQPTATTRMNVRGQPRPHDDEIAQTIAIHITDGKGQAVGHRMRVETCLRNGALQHHQHRHQAPQASRRLGIPHMEQSARSHGVLNET
jgi:hypothetical protein